MAPRPQQHNRTHDARRHTNNTSTQRDATQRDNTQHTKRRQTQHTSSLSRTATCDTMSKNTATQLTKYEKQRNKLSRTQHNKRRDDRSLKTWQTQIACTHFATNADYVRQISRQRHAGKRNATNAIQIFILLLQVATEIFHAML